MPEGSCKEMDKNNFPPGNYLACYEIIVPLIETQIFLPYLKNNLVENGVEFETRKINDLVSLSAEAKIVVNCTGLGSKQLCNDAQLIPVKGQVALLSPIKEMDIFLDNEKPLYIVPRRDAIIIGGTYEENVFTETTDEKVLENILQNAYEVFPSLKNQQQLASWAGLRPYRREVRVERESGTNIIHNYGHGGSGFTLAFGSAGVVKNIIDTW
ncbi:MAG: FAD-dependent oxidoreductase [Chitinophagaceae bacterium]